MKNASGTHTWPLFTSYERCPHCGFIAQSRSDYETHGDKQVKHLACDRCHGSWSDEKPVHKGLFPLFGRGG